MLTLALAVLISCADKPADDTAAATAPFVLDEAAISLSSESLAFGVLVHPEDGDVSLPLTISNTGAATLGPLVFELDGDDYTVDDGEPLLLAPGESAEVLVGFVPTALGDSSGVLTVRSNDPDDPAVDVELTGTVLGGRLVVTPETYDFGAALIGCEHEQLITLANAGDAALTVHSVEFNTGSIELSLDMEEAINGPLPWVLSPGSTPLEVTVRYAPEDEVSDVSYLKFSSDDLADPTATVTQEGYGTIYGVNTDTYVQRLHGPIDILFAVDKSCSMDDDIQNVRANFSLFASTLASLDSDFHVGAVVADAGCFAGTDNYIDEAMSTSAQQNAFDNMLDGVAGTFTEAPFQLMSNALALTGAGGCNEGFLRDNATLALVSVSDEEEQSPNSWEYYVELFQGLKNDDDDVIIHAIAGDVPDGCDTNGPGTGHYEATVETGGEFLSICSTDFGAHLQAIAANSLSANDTFTLSLAPVPETLSVEVDGLVATAWAYDVERNAVVFDAGSLPAGGLDVMITYEIQPECF